ncbi:PucR family transcriptional regulator [Clostridium sp. 'White wine YQ']|uniref:PucR family transcriptional regulator n=1 Tax=Clostridium sp. 'White wine YQ' TaxID=3027474 RepID=UPI0023653D69|nr:helix-turn-helix domain-containing protein [Clostridium sp. 'White wine YQ']MDD7795278.1 helix-turn-helix domain-containing protein [Clostridium sp. 'White wine YQ']
MDSFKDYVREFMNKFPYIIEVTDKYGNYICESTKNKKLEGIHFPIQYNDTVYYIEIEKKEESSIPLLRFIFEEKLKEVQELKGNELFNLIKGDSSFKENAEVLNNILDKGTLILIKAKNHCKEVYDIVKYSYNNEEEYKYCIWEEYVVLLGIFDEVYDHCKSILHNVQELNIRSPRIALEALCGKANIKEALKNLKSLIELSDRTGIRKDILTSSNIIFERVMDGINHNLKEEIIATYKNYLDSQDSDTLKTIETFFQRDLNISDASKELFVHRNTLLYRLDKIKRETSMDLRNFNEAMTFYVIYFVWKSNSR